MDKKLSLDEFAAAAMQGILSSIGNWKPATGFENLAITAYDYAEAMVAEGKKRAVPLKQESTGIAASRMSEDDLRIGCNPDLPYPDLHLPWKVSEMGISHVGNQYQCTFFGVDIFGSLVRFKGTSTGKSEMESKDSAKRIVACVNACYGVSSEMLDLGVENMFHSMTGYKEERDELMERVTEYFDAVDSTDPRSLSIYQEEKGLRSAVARMKGSS